MSVFKVIFRPKGIKPKGFNSHYGRPKTGENKKLRFMAGLRIRRRMEAILYQARGMALRLEGFRKRWWFSERDKRFYRDEQQRIVNKLTNWQRNQWARAGYPQDVRAIRPYLELVHP